MAKITLADIRLSDCNLETLPLLAQLRGQALAAEAEVCMERARHVTTYLRDLASAEEPQIVRDAKAMRCFLSNKAPRFFDGNLLAGTTTSKRLGVPVYPELTGSALWPQLGIPSRLGMASPRWTQEEAEELRARIFPYWRDRNLLESGRHRTGNAPAEHLMARIVGFIRGKAGTLTPAVPWYCGAMERGLNWVIGQAAAEEYSLRAEKRAENAEAIAFCEAVQEVLTGLNTYAANLGRFASLLAEGEKDWARSRQLATMAEVCVQIPARPARNFREAVNALWLLQVGLRAGSATPTRRFEGLDQVLYPWYRQDLDEGTLTEKEAVELVGCLWLKLHDCRTLIPEAAQEPFGGSGTITSVALGGIDGTGEDAVNDLTYVMLRATELLKTPIPSLDARCHPDKNNHEYLQRVAEVRATIYDEPALHPDPLSCQAVEDPQLASARERSLILTGLAKPATSGRPAASGSPSFITWLRRWNRPSSVGNSF
jgi:formate C-acetyltransferase